MGADAPARVVRLDGEIDLANAAELGRGILGSLGAATALVVDLSAVTYFDSAGLRMLDELGAACDAGGIRFRVVAPNGGAVRFILRIAAWRRALIAETLDGALVAIS